jgi:hypothetical protein
MKKFNTFSLEEQLGLRVYNLETRFSEEEVVDKLKWACGDQGYSCFEDEFWRPIRHTNKERDMIYIQVVQIVKYFGKELTLRFLSFNFKEELERVG